MGESKDDKQRFIIESYLGLEGSTHKYLIKFINSAKKKIVSRNQILQKQVVSKIRKSKIKTDSPFSSSDNIPRSSKKIPGMNLKLIALDAATETTGYAAFNLSKLKTVDDIKVSGSDKWVRISKMVNKIEEIIDKYEANWIILEDIYLGKGGVKTYCTLANLQGAIIYMLKEKGVKFELINPSVWKNKMGTMDKRKASKEKAIEMVRMQTGETLSDDKAEAAVIGKYALNNLVNWLGGI